MNKILLTLTVFLVMNYSLYGDILAYECWTNTGAKIRSKIVGYDVEKEMLYTTVDGVTESLSIEQGSSAMIGEVSYSLVSFSQIKWAIENKLPIENWCYPF